MEYAVIALTVVFGAGLTFFSGFGLGTLLLPVFSIYFEPHIAVGATAIVHLANNVFKFAMVSKYIHFSSLLRFGIPALIFASIGGYLLTFLGSIEALHIYEISGKKFEINAMKIVIGVIMIFFAWVELSKRFNELTIENKHVPLGGALSGFFGGVSGHQGAFRAAFLSKSGLTKEQFIGTSNAVSMIVDITRISIYLFAASAVASSNNLKAALTDETALLVVAIIFAFLGTFIGKRLVQKTTMKGIQRTVGILLFVMGGLMIAGVV